MSYNGSGTFQINTTGQPVVTGTVISSSAFNALTADLATGLSTAITKDGQTATTARIPFAAGISSTLVTDSSSVSTGSIITAGGVGVAKAVYVGTTLNVAGATTAASGSFTSLSDSGNLTFTGTGNRIIADFSNATLASRVAFQSSTTNGATTVFAIPNGTGTTAGFFANTDSSLTNGPEAQLTVNGTTDVRISSGIRGTGSYLPMTFYTGGAESLRLSATTKAVILAGGSTSANGTGITFPATQSASSDANTLDDYEEGTWTPAGGGLTNNVTATYTKVGRLVHANFDVTFPGGGAATQGNITGLPFTILTPGGGGSIGFTGYITPITLNIERSVTYFYFVTFAGVGVTYANLNGVRIIGSLVYSV